ncbi:hypothetical protein [uncultured Winogradskyella sp.]|uniref:hypothetical protein n=1 Tax=uncultured Winogradskyella sp. TaxID=395353 RepID=UPI002616E7CA|nr:hypothetical protein [uncultured Winogradskyella sp.]
MTEDNLNYGKLYNRENSHFGTINSITKSDTIFNFNDKDYKLKRLFVERKYGNETYVYSESDSIKLADNRNILKNVGGQIHPNEIASELQNSIIYYYLISGKNMNVSEEFRLVSLKKKKLNNKVFEIPNHKDARGFKRENKKKGRFKFYELVD